jgi:methionyl-tRNA formyltransferase
MGNSLYRIKKIFQQFIKIKYLNYLATHIFTHGFQPLVLEDVNNSDFVESIPAGSFGFIAGFNQIFKSPIINRFSLFINFHPSLLPYYRGTIPSYWVIKNNEQTTGFTAHKVTSTIDSGEVIFQEIITVEKDISEEELDQKIAKAGSRYFCECLHSIVSGEPLRRYLVKPQYSHKINYVSPTRS